MIQDFTSPSQWCYVDTNSNPADDTSRGLSETAQLRQRWFEGQEFLWKPDTEWPQQSVALGEIPDYDLEVKKVVAASTSIIDNSASTVNKLIEYHSNWYRLKMSVAVFLRIKAVLWRWRQNWKKNERGTDTTEPHSLQSQTSIEV